MNCTAVAPDVINCNGTVYVVEQPPLSYHDSWFWIYLGIYVGLVLCAGIISGLTLGLLSLDQTSLKVLMEAGTPSQQKNARRILPLIKRHHLLLVTLLLANAAAVESMPLFMDKISDPLTAILVSVTAVLLFGEVFPQAICTRYGLSIGATMTPFVYFLMGLTFVVSWPLAKFLDCLLGREHATFFRRAELKALVDLHGPEQQGSPQDSPLSYDEVLIIKGALEMRDKVVRDAMVPLDSVFMVEVNSRMDKATMNEILRGAHSRVPVYEKTRDNILGVLLVKTLIMLDPDDAVPIRRVMQRSRCFGRAFYATATTPLFDLLNEFQKGKSHLAIVTEPVENSESFSIVEPACVNFADDPPGRTLGIITLEDVIEELLMEEIVDETDVFVDVHRRIRVARAKSFISNRSSDADSVYTGFSGWSGFSSRSGRHGARTPRNALSAAPSLATERETTENDESLGAEQAENETAPLLRKNSTTP